MSLLATEVYEPKELAEKDFGKVGKGQFGVPWQLFRDLDFGAAGSWEYLELSRTVRGIGFEKWWLNVLPGAAVSQRIYEAVKAALHGSSLLDGLVKQLKTVELLQLTYRWRMVSHDMTPDKLCRTYDRVCDSVNFWEHVALRSKKPEEGRRPGDGFFPDSALIDPVMRRRHQVAKTAWERFCARRFALLDEVLKKSPVAFAKLWQAHASQIARCDDELVKWMWKKFDELGKKDCRYAKLSEAMCDSLEKQAWPNGYCARS